ALKLPVEPAGQIAQRLDNRLLRICGHVLICRTVPLYGNRHAIFVIIMAAMAGLCANLIEVSALDRLQGIGDTVKRNILRRIFPDQARSLISVGIESLEAGAISLAPEAPEPDAGFLPGAA